MIRTKIQCWVLTTSLMTLFVLTGCSNKQRLEGTVTFADDGTPVPGGIVLFTSPTLYAQGPIKPDGRYRVGTDSLEDGIPPGNYTVRIVGTEEITFKKNKHGHPLEMRKRRVDPKYEKDETSGLSFKVDGKTKVFNIQVERVR